MIINDNDNINGVSIVYCTQVKINNNKKIIKNSTHRKSVNANINFDEKKKSNNGIRREFL